MSKSSKPSALSKLYALGSLFFDKRTPQSAKWLIVASLIYTIFPVDIVPDFIIGAGWLDDITALVLAGAYYWQKTKRLMPPR